MPNPAVVGRPNPGGESMQVMGLAPLRPSGDRTLRQSESGLPSNPWRLQRGIANRSWTLKRRGRALLAPLAEPRPGKHHSERMAAFRSISSGWLCAESVARCFHYAGRPLRRLKCITPEPTDGSKVACSRSLAFRSRERPQTAAQVNVASSC